VSYPPQSIHYHQTPLQKNTNLPQKKKEKKRKKKKTLRGFYSNPNNNFLVYKKYTFETEKNLSYPPFVMKEMHRKHTEKRRKRRSTKNPFMYPASTLIIIITTTHLLANYWRKEEEEEEACSFTS
jgi:hypothetical protein